MGEICIQSILRDAFPAYADRHRLPLRQHEAAWAIRNCRTAALGGHAEVCPHGHHTEVWYNSCRHRACPQCAHRERERWLEHQKAKLLETPHFHVVFTVPSELRILWRWNPKEFGNLLFHVVRDTLFTLLGDEQRLGALPGMILALHTWGRTLIAHPHIHCVVTGGGVTPKGEWKKIRNGYLLPLRVVRPVYRGKLLSGLEKMIRRGELQLPSDLSMAQALALLRCTSRKTWNVRIEEQYAHGRGVANYLARYLRGGPLKNPQLQAFDGTQVSFRYRDYRDSGKNSLMTLSVAEFQRRLLQHVPPKGMQVVRAYGLYHHRHREALEDCRASLGVEAKVEPSAKKKRRCPVCDAGLLVIEICRPEIRPSLPGRRGPPAKSCRRGRTC